MTRVQQLIDKAIVGPIGCARTIVCYNIGVGRMVVGLSWSSLRCMVGGRIELPLHGIRVQ